MKECAAVKTYSLKWILGCSLLGLAGVASAATITDLVTFSATGFSSTPTSGLTPPTDPVTGSFTITFDPTQTYTSTTALR